MHLFSQPDLSRDFRKADNMDQHNAVFQAPAKPPIQRQKSVHRRVLSKVKDGLLLRSRSCSKMLKGAELRIEPVDSEYSTPSNRSRKRRSCHDVPLHGGARHERNVVEADLSKSGSIIIESASRSTDLLPNSRTTYDSIQRSPSPLRPLHLELMIAPDEQCVDIDNDGPVWASIEVGAVVQNPTDTELYSSESLRSHSEFGSGQLLDIDIEILPSQDCVILKTIGAHHIERMHTGQRHCLAIQISLLPSSKTISSTTERSATDRNSQELYDELECLLGSRLLSAFSVRASYKHSLFPPDTFLSINRTCTIRNISSASVWSLAGPMPTKAQRTVRIPPSDSVPDSAGMHSRNTAGSTSSSRSSAADSPDPVLTDNTTSNERKSDAAQMIWRQMRRVSRGTAENDLTEESSPDCTETMEKQLSVLHMQALSNKRSLGADTLREFYTLGQKEETGAVGRRCGSVPWLM